jgi:hypothetical protein
MTKTGFRLPPYLKAKNGSSRTNEFNDLENRKSRGIPLRDPAPRKRVDAALDYLHCNLHGMRRGTTKHDHLIDRVRASRRPLSTAKAICRDHLKVDRRGSECDSSDVQELWVKVFKRQGRLIYPEQERIFRQLDRDAIRGTLSRGDLERADKVLRMFKAGHAGSQVGQDGTPDRPGTERGWWRIATLSRSPRSTAWTHKSRNGRGPTHPAVKAEKGLQSPGGALSERGSR